MSSHLSNVEPSTSEPAFAPNSPRSTPAAHIGPAVLSHSPSSISRQRAGSHRPIAARLKSASISQPARPVPVSKHRHAASSTALPIGKTVDFLHAPLDEQQPSEEPNFLTILAAQERRVLEVKEELQKAEEELQRLKKQWSSQEASNRRNEGRRIHQLRPLSTSSTKDTAITGDGDGSSAWMYEEMERRKALMGRGRQSSRRLFTGARGPRPLSLVAMNPNILADFPEPRQSLDNEGSLQSNVGPDMLPEESRARSPTSFFRSASSSPQRSQRQSMPLSGTKQLASEWKEGLWTFFEDLKHATVGDEARTSRSSSSADTKRSSFIEQDAHRTSSDRGRKPTRANIEQPTEPRVPEEEEEAAESTNVIDVRSLIDADEADWTDPGPREIVATPQSKSIKRSKKEPPTLPLHTRIVDGEAWDTWDSPEVKMPSSAHSSNNSISVGNVSPSPQPSTPASSTTDSTDATPRQSLGPVKSRESIPWPALNKLAPGQLRRTASHLIDKWEKSLDVKGSTKSSRAPSPIDSLVS